MDAFEQIISQLLMEDGYWNIIGYKADIKQSEANLLKKSKPRPEIDIVAYNPKRKIIYLIEVKSFIDSTGVGLNVFDDLKNNNKGRYKLLTWEKYRDIVSEIVVNDLFEKGLLHEKNVTVEYGLIAGNLAQQLPEKDFKDLFKSKGYSAWLVWGPETVNNKIRALAKKGYENNTVTIISKLMNPEIRKDGQKERQKKRRSS